jgi:hypothetical protein
MKAFSVYDKILEATTRRHREFEITSHISIKNPPQIIEEVYY